MGIDHLGIKLGGKVQFPHPLIKKPLRHIGASEQVMGSCVATILSKDLFNLGYTIIGPFLGQKSLRCH